jgi:hypothetical protein
LKSLTLKEALGDKDDECVFVLLLRSWQHESGQLFDKLLLALQILPID